MTDPKYVMDFCREVYPENTELALSVNNEKTLLTDATNLIRSLRAERDAARAAWLTLQAENGVLKRAERAALVTLESLRQNLRGCEAIKSDLIRAGLPEQQKRINTK